MINRTRGFTLADHGDRRYILLDEGYEQGGEIRLTIASLSGHEVVITTINTALDIPVSRTTLDGEMFEALLTASANFAGYMQEMHQTAEETLVEATPDVLQEDFNTSPIPWENKPF